MTLRAVVPVLLALASTAALAAAPLEVSGRIRDDDGLPVAGARVELARALPSIERGRLLVAGQARPEPVAVALTDDEGVWSLETEAGMWGLRVEAPGYVPLEYRLSPLLEPAVVPEARLRRAVDLAVKVRSPDGEPVAGAWVWMSPDDPRFWRRSIGRLGWNPGTRRGRTGDDGRVVLPRAAAESVRVRALANGFAEPEATTTRQSSATLTLDPARAVDVRVVGRGGDAASGALLRAGDRGWPVAVADENGHATLWASKTGETRVLAESAAGEVARLTLSPPFDDEPLRLRLEPPRTLGGRVIDAATREALPGAWVWASDPAEFATTGPDGGYQVISNSAGERQWVQATAPGYSTEFVQTAAGSEQAGTLALAPLATLAGRVVDDAGRAIAGADVSATVEPGGRGISPASRTAKIGLTDERGAFRLRGLEPDRRYVVRAAHDGYAPAETTVAEFAALETRTGVELVLTSGGKLVGRAVDENGEPLAGVLIELEPAIEASSPRAMFAAANRDDVTAFEGVSDEEGVFEVAHLPAGRFDLEARLPGFAPAQMRGIEVPEAEVETDMGEVALVAGVSVEGRVVDERGAALAGAEVRVAPKGPMASMRIRALAEAGQGAVTSDAAGLFSIDDRLPGERLDLEVKLSGYAAKSVPGIEAPTASPITIALVKASAIRGRVVDDRGEGVARAFVMVEASGSGVAGPQGVYMGMRASARAATLDDGSFELTDVAPGTARLLARAEGYREVQISELTVPAGRDLEDLEIVLEKGAAIFGRVTGADGKPLLEAFLMVTHQGASFMAGARTDGDGRYRIDGVEPGWRIVTVHHESLEQISREIEVQPGDNRLDISYEPGYAVGGRVIAEDGSPVAGAEIHLSGTHGYGGGQSAQSRDDGSFEIADAANGTYKVRGSKQGFATAELEREIVVRDAPVYGVEVVLPVGGAIVGRVVGLEPGELPSVEIWARSSGRSFLRAQPDFSGNYRLSGVTAGDWTVHAALEASGKQASGQVTLAPGEAEAVLDLEFGGGLLLTGRLLRGAEPLAGARVAASGVDVASEVTGRSRADGGFQLENLEPGRHRIIVTSEHGGFLHQEEIELASDRHVEIVLSAARVSGWVTDARDSTPLAQAVIALEPLQPDDDPRTRFWNAGTRSDSRGYFLVDDVAAGSYRVKVEKEGFAPAEVAVLVESELGVEDLEIRLEPTRGLVLEVRGPNGAPVRRVDVALLDAAGNAVVSRNYTATDRGTVRLTTAPPGGWELLVSTEGAAVATLQVEVPGGPLPVALAPGAAFEIEVPALAEDSTRATVRLFGEGGQVFRSAFWGGRVQSEFQLAGGKRRLERIPAGAWTVRVTTADGRLWETRAVATGAASTPVVLD